MPASFPHTIWDGDSESRNSDNAPRRSPDWQDWNRAIEEIAATQTEFGRVARGLDIGGEHKVGSLPATPGFTVLEAGNAAMHKTIFILDNYPLVTTDSSNPPLRGAYGNGLLYTFPEGYLKILGGHIIIPAGKLTASVGGGAGLSDTADFEIAVGTMPALNVPGFGTTAGTMNQNVLPGITVGLVAGTTLVDSKEVRDESKAFNGTSVANDLYLNMRTLADDDHGPLPDVLVVTAIITMLWSMLGDN